MMMAATILFVIVAFAERHHQFPTSIPTISVRHPRGAAPDLMDNAVVDIREEGWSRSRA